MIPKVIHYCWFGHSPLPGLAVKCIDSWKKYLPDYKIIEWNEDNYDINSCAYVEEAYRAKKWAFVSDYARFDILYQYGGLYFDTDVEVIKPIDDIVAKGSFMGCEQVATIGNVISTANPGLGLYKVILDEYSKRHFIREDGSYDQMTIVAFTTDILKKYGFDSGLDSIQTIEQVTIYPPEFFCPLDYMTGKLTMTENTRSIHHYSESWHVRFEKIVANIQKVMSRYGTIATKAGTVIVLPLITLDRIQKIGMKDTVKSIMRYITKNIRGYFLTTHLYHSIIAFYNSMILHQPFYRPIGVTV